MKRNRFTEGQIAFALRQDESGVAKKLRKCYKCDTRTVGGGSMTPPRGL